MKKIFSFLILILLIPFILAVPPGTDTLPEPDTTVFPDAKGEPVSEDDIRLETDEDEYFLQDTIEIKGYGFSAEADNVELDFFGESVFPEVDENGRFEEEYEIPITVDKGEHTIVAINHEETTQNPDVTITIVYPEPVIYALPTLDNETPLLLGEDFLNNETVIVEFKSKDYEVRTETDGSFELELPKQQEGNYSVYAEQKTISEINASGKVEVYEEIPLKTYYEDSDGDGYGSEETTNAITAPTGYVDNNQDCDDTSAAIFPGASESCNGFDNDCDGTPDNGATCTNGNCEAGRCVEKETTATNSGSNTEETTTQTTNNNQGNQNNRVDPPTTEQPQEVNEGFNIWWILIPLLIAVLLAGGVLGYVAYEGCLDFESLDGFTNGIKKAFGAETSSPTPSSFSSSAAPNRQLLDYIMKKRTEGYDDLTIRNALLKNNWPESEVDRTFDSLYK